MNIITSIKKNFFYNTLYNILTLILPLITTPYIARVMGAERIGIYSYSYSIASYFSLFILLGLNNYGNRTIACIRDNKNELSKTFWSIYFMQLFMAIIVILLYVGYVGIISTNRKMAWIQLIYIISVSIDINWFFFGMEQFKLTVSRNTFVKILNVLCIFLMVKDQDDIYIYGIIMSIGPLISQSILWGFLRKYICFIKISISDVFRHIKPNLILFIPVIAISLYTILDKIMLGIMSNMMEVGYYENSSKLTQVPSMVVTSLGTVMLPRVSNLISKGKKNEVFVYIEKSLFVSILMSSSIAFGLCAVSIEFVPLFFGPGYEKCIIIISILVFSSIFMSWANVIRTQYLIPNKHDDVYIISVSIGAIVNIFINVLLIPIFGAVGAAIGTLFAEAAVCIYQTIKVRKVMNIKLFIKRCIPIIICSLFMFLIVVNIPFIHNLITTIFIKIIIGLFTFIISFYIVYIKILKTYRRNIYKDLF